MKKKIWVVVTSINSPTPAIETIAALAEKRAWGVVVVGDVKTPHDWAYPGVDYLSVEAQKDRYGEFASLIPWRHYCRKNLGYLYAMEQGAEWILETDDDNIPYETFGEDVKLGVTGKSLGGGKWVNIYAQFTTEHVWPRGLPLDAIRCTGELREVVTFDCPIQQYLADEDPDVDAIWRLVFKHPVMFRRDADSIVPVAGSYVPFNSQNTLFFKNFFPLLYLPCFVSFRMTDIWRSFVAQRVLWSEDKHLCFHAATVRQQRNEHDLLKDFRDEVDGYLNNRRIGEALDDLDLSKQSDISQKVRLCWQALHEIGVVEQKELGVMEEWLRRVSRF